MTYRLLKPEEIPWERLDRFEDRCVFQTRAWLNFLAESQGATPVVAELREGNEVVGYFSGLTFRRFGLKMLGSSFPGWATPYIGFNLLPGVPRRDALEALGRLAFGELKCLHFEVSDRLLPLEDGEELGLERGFAETYESDLTLPEEELFRRMTSACRRCIRKAEKTGLVVEEAGDAGFAGEYYEQLKDVFARQNKVPPYGLQRVQLLLEHLHPTGNLLLLRARTPDGRPIATGIYPGFNKVAHFWGNASWRADQIWRPNEALHWHAMRYWKRRGMQVFDWGGGGAYKEKYGVTYVTVPWFYKSRYRALSVLREQARKAFYRWQGIAGRWRRSRPEAPEAEDRDGAE